MLLRLINTRWTHLLAPLVALGLIPVTMIVAEEASESVVVVSDEEPEPSAESEEVDPRDEQIKEMRKEIERLRVEQELREAQLQESLQELKTEGQRIEAELSIAGQRRRAELAELDAERERLQAEDSLKEAQHAAAMRELRQQQEQRSLAHAQKEQDLQMESLEAREATIEQERLAAELEFANHQRQFELSDMQFEMQRLDTQLAAFHKRQEAQAVVQDPITRIDQPFVDGVLTISDRRIDLNEPIIEGTGSWIARRINYFNNDSSEDPIFLVIDYCPGGSIMDGEIILRAIRASDAPVHVVVKTMAASMAAIIVGDAPHSYALPNAMILHHQPWSYTWGNLAQQKEGLEMFREWAERIHGPTAERMGLSLEEFYTRMYEESVTGDWIEFGDNAQEIAWVQNVAQEIREQNVRQKPDDESPWQAMDGYWSSENSSERDEQVRLPRPRAMDFYFLHNRDGRFYVGSK